MSTGKMGKVKREKIYITDKLWVYKDQWEKLLIHEDKRNESK